MRRLALAALVVSPLAHAQPLVADLVDSEFSVSGHTQLSPAGSPSVGMRGGALGGSATGTDASLTEAASFGAFFEYDIDLGRQTNRITAQLKARSGLTGADQLSSTATSLRRAWIAVDRPIRYRVTGVVGSELTTTGSEWGAARFTLMLEGAEFETLAMVSANEGEQPVLVEGVLEPTPAPYFFIFEASSSVVSMDLGDRGARAWADVTLELLPFGCTFADIAAPYDALNIGDVIGFLGAWSDADPVADYERPFGQFDLSDITAFLDLYAAGCP